jgi:hypothetical protein
MANQEHLDILNHGVEAWNRWREKHYELVPNLYEIDLSWRNLSGANLCQTDLGWTNLSYAQLEKANLSDATGNGAFLEQATLKNAILIRTNLSKADLSGANLFEANLRGTQLTGAKLERASLARAILDSTTLTGATLTHCLVYGVSAWNVQLADATQLNLVITPPNEPTITVDNLKIAQFIYLLLNNKEIRDVINTLTTKSVLILGRFTHERKAVLDALREALRTHRYVPILFDFDRPSSRNVTETVKTLAHLSRFIIADLTDPSSIPYELGQIVPGLAVPVQPVLLEGRKAFAMFLDLPRTYHWVLPIHYYTDQAHLLATLKEQVIEPAEQKAKELEKR